MISAHISETEAFRNNIAEKHGIKNIPDAETLKRMRAVALMVFEPLRKHFGTPILITSFFRCLNVELLAGRVGNSQHVKGEAMDIKSGSMTVSNAELFLFIRDHLIFDQLIWEKGDESNPAWVHVSYKEKNNRRQVLKTNDGIRYEILTT